MKSGNAGQIGFVQVDVPGRPTRRLPFARGAIAPSNPQRDGITNMSGRSIGFVVIGHHQPAEDDLRDERDGRERHGRFGRGDDRRDAAARARWRSWPAAISCPSSSKNAVGPPSKPSVKKTMPSSIAHWKTQKNAEEEVLRKHVVEEAKVHHPLAQVDGALGDDLARGVARTEPDAAHDDEEHRGRVIGRRLHRVEEIRRRRSDSCCSWSKAPEARRDTRYGTASLLPAEDEPEQDADDGRLQEHDGGARAVADLDLPVARQEEPELSTTATSARCGTPRRCGRRPDRAAARSTSCWKSGLSFRKNSARQALRRLERVRCRGSREGRRGASRRARGARAR